MAPQKHHIHKHRWRRRHSNLPFWIENDLISNRSHINNWYHACSPLQDLQNVFPKTYITLKKKSQHFVMRNNYGVQRCFSNTRRQVEDVWLKKFLAYGCFTCLHISKITIKTCLWSLEGMHIYFWKQHCVYRHSFRRIPKKKDLVFFSKLDR
jgi:hypothetical protein